MTDTTQNASAGAESGADTDAPTALYHGACPICGTEIDHYRRYCAERGIDMGWRDISDGTDPAPLESLGLDREDAKKRMTVVGPDGTVHRGVDAFIVLWSRMPRYRWLARFVSLPGIRSLADATYDRVLAPALYAWNRRRGRAGT